MFQKLQSSLSQNRLMGGALVLACFQLTASVMGLLRDRLLASTFPELGVTDVYIAAFRPSDLLFQVTVMAAFSVALVPMLAAHHAKDDKQQMTQLLSSVVAVAATVFGALALALALALPAIAPLLTSFSGEQLELYISFARIALLTNFLFVFGNAFGQYLITVQKYWIYGLTPVLYTLGTILGTIYLTPEFGAFGPIYGTLVGAILYVLLRYAAVMFNVQRSTFNGSLWHDDLKKIGTLMLPRMIALGALQAELLYFDNVASRLDVGSVTINAYARNFQAVAVGIAGIALAQSAFSLLSQAAANGEQKRFWIYLRKGIGILLGVTIPGAVLLYAVAPIAASLVSLSHVLSVFTLCLLFYCVSIPFESINHLLLRAFYATKHTVTPAIFSVVNGTIAILAALKLAPLYGVYAIAIAFTLGQVVQMIGLGLLLPRRVRELHS